MYVNTEHPDWDISHSRWVTRGSHLRNPCSVQTIKRLQNRQAWQPQMPQLAPLCQQRRAEIWWGTPRPGTPRPSPSSGSLTSWAVKPPEPSSHPKPSGFLTRGGIMGFLWVHPKAVLSIRWTCWQGVSPQKGWWHRLAEILTATEVCGSGRQVKMHGGHLSEMQAVQMSNLSNDIYCVESEWSGWSSWHDAGTQEMLNKCNLQVWFTVPFTFYRDPVVDVISTNISHTSIIHLLRW